MSADTPVNDIHAGNHDGSNSRPTWRRELLRIGLVPVFVALCYQFEWHSWRALWTDIFVKGAGGLGISTMQLSFDSFVFNGRLYKFVIACTAVDAFFGSIPLLWKGTSAVHRNLAFLAAYFVCLSGANLIRLELGFLLYTRGISWFMGHEMMAGLFYFALFLWIARQRGWDQWISGDTESHQAHLSSSHGFFS